MIILVSIFAIFIPALMLPGPDFIAVVRSSMTRGVSAGILTTAGVTLGLGFYASLSLLGLSAILVEYQWLAWTIRILGACYLAYLGVRLIMSKPQRLDLPPDSEKLQGNPFIFGFFVTLTNPKAIVLFTSVFATSVTGEAPTWLMTTAIGIVVVSSFVWYTVVSVFMSSDIVIRKFRNTQHWIERAAGVCFIGISARILADSRNPVTP